MNERSPIAAQLLRAAQRLGRAANRLQFSPPVTHVYNPLIYAWAPHAAYLRAFGASRKRVILLGMNPGPFGMAQTGVPFGEIASVRDWLGIQGDVGKPSGEHPRRPVQGFSCLRCEISGQRLWGLIARRFGTPQHFFAEHMVLNYCPLVFMEHSGRNRTPDKLPASERELLFEICDEHLRSAVDALEPEWLVGIGEFAAARARAALGHVKLKFGKLCHPSPASPAANRDWGGMATRQLVELGIWSESETANQ